MKVLHLLKTSEGAMWAYRQIEVLRKNNIEVHVVLPQLKGRLYDRLKQLDVELIELDLNINKKRPYLIFRQVKALRELMRRINPDIIHSHFVVTTYLMRVALKKSGIPRIFQVPGPLHLEKRPFGDLDVFLSDRNDHWIATCKWTKEKYIQMGIPEHRVFLSYYGTVISNFKNETKGKLREELGISQATPIIGMVAYMYPPKKYLGHKVGIKGHEDFIEAIELVKQEIPEVKAIIVGEPWDNGENYERSLKEMARKKCGNSIIFLGFRNDVPQIYPDFDVAVHPSLTENLGGAVESLLAEIPTIATNIGGFPDIVIDHKTGLLVEPRNPRMLAQKIVEMINNKEASLDMANEGKKLVKELLNVEKTGREIVEIYSTILQKELQEVRRYEAVH